MTNPSAQTMLAEIGPLLDAFLHKLNSQSDAALAQALWDNKVGIVSVLHAASAPAAVRKVLNREELAQLIDPGAFRSWQSLYDWCLRENEKAFSKRCADSFHGEKINETMSRADAILALATPEEASTAAREAVALDHNSAGKAAEAIERFRQNRMTTFTPTNILDDFGDIILSALYAAPPAAQIDGGKK